MVGALSMHILTRAWPGALIIREGGGGRKAKAAPASGGGCPGHHAAPRLCRASRAHPAADQQVCAQAVAHDCTPSMIFTPYITRNCDEQAQMHLCAMQLDLVKTEYCTLGERPADTTRAKRLAFVVFLCIALSKSTLGSHATPPLLHPCARRHGPSSCSTEALHSGPGA